MTRLGLQTVRQVHGEAAMQLGLVKKWLVASLGFGSVGVLLDQALINLPDGLLGCCLLKNGATQIQVVSGDHLHGQTCLAYLPSSTQEVLVTLLSANA